MKRKILIIAVSMSACLLLAALPVAAWVWFNIRPLPAEKNHTIFQGITYVRDVRQSPRPMVVHVLKIDLRDPGISFLVTPGDPKAEQPLQARTTSQFLEEFGVQLAVNGDGFTPWYSNSPLDYYPHPGDPVDAVGLAASRGTIYSQPTDGGPTLYISRNNRARFNSPLGRIHNAISGNLMLVEGGKPLAGLESEPEPRTALALDKRQRTLIIVLVDGRQPNFSEGVTLQEMAKLLIDFGGHTGMNLDGGGSTTLVMAGENGEPILLNSPIDRNIPGSERAVGNHLGIFASPVESH